MLECVPSICTKGYFYFPRWPREFARCMSLELFARYWTIGAGSPFAWSWSFNKFLNRILNRSKWKVMIFKYCSSVEYVCAIDNNGKSPSSLPIEIKLPTFARTGPWFKNFSGPQPCDVDFVLTDFIFIEVFSWSHFEQRDLQILISTNEQVYRSRELSCQNCVKLFSTEQSTIFALPWTHEACSADDVLDYIRSTFNWFKAKDKNTWTSPDEPFSILLNEKNTTFSVSLDFPSPAPGNILFVLANRYQHYI